MNTLYWQSKIHNANRWQGQAQEVDVSDMDFEDEDEDEEMGDDDQPATNGALPPSKKRKA